MAADGMIARLQLEIRRAWRWWVNELVDTWRDANAWFLRHHPNRVVIDLSNDQLEVVQIRWGRPRRLWNSQSSSTVGLERLGQIPSPEALDVRRPWADVALGEEFVLVRELDIPRASAAETSGMLRVQYERLMPMPRREVLVSHVVIASDSVRQRVALGCLRVDDAKAIRNALQSVGWRISAFSAASLESSESLRFVSEPQTKERDGERSSLVGRAAFGTFLFGLAALVLAMAVGWYPHNARVQADIASQMAKHGPLIQSARELRALNENLLQVEAQRPESSTIELLSALTHTTPDPVWLERVSRRAESVRILGHAADVAGFVEQLSAHPALADIRLRTARPNATGGQTFEITLASTEKEAAR